MIRSVLGPVATVTSQSYVYDLPAFLANSGAHVVIYVIDANTSKIAHIEQRVFSDITDGDALRAMAGATATFPAGWPNMRSGMTVGSDRRIPGNGATGSPAVPCHASTPSLA